MKMNENYFILVERTIFGEIISDIESCDENVSNQNKPSLFD